MSGKKHDSKAGLADWTVVCHDGHGNSHRQPVTAARVRRDLDGGYVFTDDQGIKADFAPGTASHVLRADPEREPLILNPPKSLGTLTANQIRDLQDALNVVAEDLAWRFKVQVVPPGSKVTEPGGGKAA